MPRKGRGGKRAGKPQKAYGNRSDLNSVKELPVSTTGNEYGERKRREDAVAAMPIPTGGGTARIAPRADRRPVPQPIPGGFAAKTARPNEPLTAGLPMGPGPNQPPVAVDQTSMELRAIYSKYPSEALRGIIEDLETGGR